MLFFGDLGLDATGRSVLPQLLFRFPRTLILISAAFVLCSAFGIAAGLYFSYRSRSRNRLLHLLLTSSVLSLPDILIIILLQSFMIVLNRNNLPYLPVSGCTSLVSVVLPAISLSIIPAFYMARITYTLAKSAYEEKFILTARAKGCSERRILTVHIWKRIRPGVVKSLQSLVPVLVSNLIVVKWLFNFTGVSFNLYKTFSDGNDFFLLIGWIIALAVVYIILTASIYLLRILAAGGRTE